MPNQTMLVALSFMESHGAAHNGQPRTLTSDELRAVAHYFGVPNQGPDRAKGAAVLARWTWSTPVALDAFPRQYLGEAEGGERFRCADYGCPCGWEYGYSSGEPMAAPAAQELAA